MQQLKRLIEEIHRRNLWQVLAIYLGASWLVFEIVQTLTEGLGLPGWFPPLALVLLLVGLPIVLATAFVQQGLPAAAQPDPTLLPPSRTPDLADPVGRSRYGPRRFRDLLTWRNALLGGMAAFALWGVVAAGWLLVEGRSPEGATATGGAAPVDDEAAAASSESAFRASVAVLPFDNLGSPEDEYFSQGITEEIISQLARVEGLKVISRTSVLALRGAALTVPEIADTLGVRHVLEGSVRRSADRVRITAQLIDAETDAHLWTESYTRRPEDVFELQDEIAAKVSHGLVASVEGLRPSGGSDRAGLTTAYDAYLTGQHWMHKRTPEGLRRAAEAFEEAIGLDSTYAPAYAGLARAQLMWVALAYSGGPDAYATLARALSAADRAVALDPNLAEGYLARGLLLNGTWAPAERVAIDFERALELQPNSADVRGWYAHFLERESRFDEALVEARKAVELDPLAPGRRLGYAGNALAARRYDIALREARTARALEPALVTARLQEAVSLLLLGRPEECLELDVSPALGPVRAMCLYSAGERALASSIVDSLAVVAEAGDLSGGPNVSELGLAQDLALYHAWVGDAERSLAWLERAYDLSPYILVDPLLPIFDRVRDEPGFREGFERIKEQARDRLRRSSEAVSIRP